MKNNTNFYQKLDLHLEPIKEVLKKRSGFTNVPKNWWIVITDVVDSSSAVKRGFHNNVNLTATGSIITVLNSVNKKDNTPYFFGGDGATFIIPEVYLNKVILNLENYCKHIKKIFDLELRVGKMSVEEVSANKISLKIAKIKHNNFLITPMVLGNGLKFAENKIKEKYIKKTEEKQENTLLNLEGMECRWDEIPPDTSNKKIICLLVSCDAEENQHRVFSEILNELDLIFGDLNKRSPVSTPKLKIDTSIAKIRNEMYARLGEFNRAYLLKNWLLTLFGKYYFKYFDNGKKYLLQLPELSDTVMLDGGINTVFSGTQKQINKLIKKLDKLEEKKEILYGLHTTYASIMSCYIEDRDKKHIHFIDGTEGGYTSAANQIKAKIKLKNLH